VEEASDYNSGVRTPVSTSEAKQNEEMISAKDDGAIGLEKRVSEVVSSLHRNNP
jgi:hypothetical protein